MAGTLQILLLRTPGLPTVDLAVGSGLVLLPLTKEIVATVMPSTVEETIVDGFYNLTSTVADWARQHSVNTDVAYLHTEFFGGTGFHAAMAWRGGEVALGPLFTETTAGEAEAHYTTVADRRDMAANVLLRWLGVEQGDAVDEFAAAGLNRLRWTEEWSALSARRAS